jgi:hypothetical protein
MSCYISSNNNRLYAAIEETYGIAAAVTAANRIPAVKLAIQQEVEKPQRKDKTGTRTFWGLPSNLRRQTKLELRTYMTGWEEDSVQPGSGALLHAAMGGEPQFFSGSAAGAGCGDRMLVFSAAHGLAAGQAVSFGSELRFVSAVADDNAVVLNAPFSIVPSEGSPIGRTVTYKPADRLRSATIYDYWSPAEAVQRLVFGVGIDKLKLRVNGDFHEFSFVGSAKDVIDSGSFAEGEGGLSSYPEEPAVEAVECSIIPGHLGQAWLGAISERFFTVTHAEITLDNALDLRAREFGAVTPRCMAAGMRKVSVDFDLFGREDDATKGLYQAARQRSPIEVMFQLGQEAGQLFGIYMKSVIPEVPVYEDSETRLQWQFRGCRAQGSVDDEMVIAFG